jgi:hypothetical protein
LRRAPEGAADAEAISKALAGLADVYRALSTDGGSPSTLGDSLAIVARLTAWRELLVLALERASMPLSAVAQSAKAGDGGGRRRADDPPAPGDGEDDAEAHRWGVLAGLLDFGLARMPPRIRALPGAHALADLASEIRSAIPGDRFLAELPRLRSLWAAAFALAYRDDIADSELIYGWDGE